MSDKYNGWTNYATWKANLEFFSELCIEDLAEDFNNCNFSSEFAERLKELLEEYISRDLFELDAYLPIVQGAINYFIEDINFDEIASHYIEDIQRMELTS